MARTLTAEDEQILEGAIAKGVAKGLSDIGLGFDDETEKKAIRSDLGWVRQQREFSESRTKQVRSGFWTALTIAAVAGVLFVLGHIGAFTEYLAGFFTGNAAR